MSLNLKYQSLDVKMIGRTVSVPGNKLAKLMYYLRCVFTVIQIDEDTRLTDFENYYDLTKEEEQTVLGLCALFNPKVMTELSLFIIAPELIPEGKINQFYQLTDEKVGVHVNSEVVIGGRVIKVLKIMACKPIWIERFFGEPVDEYSRPQLPPPTNYTNYENYNYDYNNNRGCSEGCKKKFTYFIIIVIIIIIISIIAS